MCPQRTHALANEIYLLSTQRPSLDSRLDFTLGRVTTSNQELEQTEPFVFTWLKDSSWHFFNFFSHVPEEKGLSSTARRFRLFSALR